jgi:AraC-like DNA-binding protein
MNSQANLTIREFTLPPGGEWTSQARHWRFLQVCAGEPYWLGHQQSKSLAVGEVLVISPAVPAVIRASRLSEATLKGLVFAPDDLLGLFTLAEKRSLEARLAAFSEPVRFFPPHHSVARRMSAFAPPSPGLDALRQRAEALSVVAAVFDTTSFEPPPSETRCLSSRLRFQRLAGEMTELDLVRSTPGELARLCQCSVGHFHRLFRQHFGVSLRVRQNDVRLRKATHLLLATRSGIAEIAELCGYLDTVTMAQAFKAQFGVCPSTWRRQQQRSETGNGEITRQPEAPGRVSGTLRTHSPSVTNS